MANPGGSSSPDIHCVFVETNLDTRLALLVNNDESISDFKEKLLKEHKRNFPEVGEINISALKVKRRGQFFNLPDSMNMISKAFEGIRKNWFMYVDAVRVEKVELLTILNVDQNRLNPEFLEKKEEIASDSALVDGQTKDLTLKEGLKTEVKKTRKRKMESSDGKKSRKRSAIDINQSAVATTATRYAVDESKVHVEVFASESCVVSLREKMDDILMGAIGKDIESGENNDFNMEEYQQTSEMDMLCQDKILTVNSELVDGHTGGEVKDVEANQTLKEDLEIDLAMRKSDGTDESHKLCETVPIEKLGDLRGAKKQDLGKGEKSDEVLKINQEKDLVPTLDTSRDDVNESHEKLDGFLSGATEKDNGRGEVSRLAPSGVANLQTAELVTYPENQLEGSSALTTGPDTEKKKKRKKSTKDQINQSAAADYTTSREFVNVDPVSRRETLGNPPIEPMQKENEMGENSVDDVGRKKMEADNLLSHPENHLEANGGLTTRPDTEKKKRRKKSSKEIVNEISGVPGNVDRVVATPESCPISTSGNLGTPFAEARQKENEMGEKIDDNAGSRKDIPSVTNNIQTNNLVSHPENQLEANSGLKSGPATLKKRKQKKSSKDHTNQSTAATTSREIVNETEKVSGNIDPVAAISESVPNSKGEKHADTLVDAVQNENEMGDKFVDNVGPTGNLQVTDLFSTLVQESKTLDKGGKFTDENKTREHEIAKDNGDIDAGESKSMKSTKRKKSKKAKTPAKEDTLVASGAHNVEPIIKVVDAEEPDTVIRDVLDSLQQKNETEENLGKIEKKSSKKSKKKGSSNVVEAQVLSVEVNNTAQKEIPLIKETDASLTPTKKDTECQMKKSIEVADNTEDKNSPKQILKENADMGDNFGSSQKETIVGGGKKQDQVTGGVKSRKEKKNLNLHPDGSIDGSLSSMKPKERKGRVQPASSVTSHLQSRVKNDRNGSKINRSDASMKDAGNNKKEAVKKSSNSVTVNKSTMNFFKDAETDSTEDEANKSVSDVSTKSPSDSSSNDDSDVTSMSRKQGYNLAGEGETNRCSGSLQDILRSSKSFKMAKLRASQSQPDIYDDDSPMLDCVPDSQAI